MPVSHLSLDELSARVQGLPVGEQGSWPLAGTVIVVDLDRAAGSPPSLHSGVAAIVVGLTAIDRPEDHGLTRVCDLVLPPGDDALAAVVASAERTPVASTALAILLRGSQRRTVDDGLAAESAVYSTLQAGPEFAAWRAAHPPRSRRDEPGHDPVRVERAGEVLDITLDRPSVRNALDTAMRDQLVDALRIPALDPAITDVHLRGEGEAFCAGGDLDEFGSRPDPASAHLVRLQQSVGRAIDAVRDRVTVHLHGACVGSGIELPAFAGHVIADPTTRIALPEVSLGLVPGAGGTVSLPRRIGRLRTARLALTGETIDADTARDWGLVDAVDAR